MWKFIGNLVSYLEQQTKHVVSDIKRQSNFDYHCCMSAIIYVLLENMTENFSLKALVGLSDVASYN